tara:strand:- start:727 stop:963 length:237 start_codon:yes stop_codon:yes gene_type:complete
LGGGLFIFILHLALAYASKCYYTIYINESGRNKMKKFKIINIENGKKCVLNDMWTVNKRIINEASKDPSLKVVELIKE